MAIPKTLDMHCPDGVEACYCLGTQPRELRHMLNGGEHIGQGHDEDWPDATQVQKAQCS